MKLQKIVPINQPIRNKARPKLVIIVIIPDLCYSFLFFCKNVIRRPEIIPSHPPEMIEGGAKLEIIAIWNELRGRCRIIKNIICDLS